MRILATCTPGRGHLNAIVPLLLALRDAGHDVLVVTAQESVEAATAHGLPARPGGMGVLERRQAFEPRMPEVMALPPRERRGLYFAGFFAHAAAPVMRRDLEPIFADFRPDVVLHERAELAAAPMAVARGIPHATIAFSGALRQSAEALLVDAITPVWRAEGLAAPSVTDIDGDLYFHPFPPSFGQAPSHPGSRMLGPGPTTTGTPASSNPDGLAWLDRAGVDRPLVYMTAGTERAAAALAPWRDGVAALGMLDADAIVTIGAHLDPAVLEPLPPNVHVERFVPQHLILPHASVVMSHAGAGTMLGSAVLGIPQVVYPIAADQWDNADAAAGAGLAIVCEMDQRSASDIAGALVRVLTEPEFGDAGSRVAEEIRAMPAPSDHVATIAGLVLGGHA